MKIYLVKSSEEYGCAYPIKAFKNKLRAETFATDCQIEEDAEGFTIYNYYVSELEFDEEE